MINEQKIAENIWEKLQSWEINPTKYWINVLESALQYLEHSPELSSVIQVAIVENAEIIWKLLLHTNPINFNIDLLKTAIPHLEHSCELYEVVKNKINEIELTVYIQWIKLSKDRESIIKDHGEWYVSSAYY